MKADTGTTLRLRAFVACCVLTFVWSTSAAEPVVIEMDLPGLDATEQASSYIVQAADKDAAADAVESVGGRVTLEIDTTQSVRAMLLPPQVELLKRRSDVHQVFEDTSTQTSSNAT